MNTQNKGEGNAYAPISSISNNAQLNNRQTECNTPANETNKKTNGEATVCTRKVERFRTEWPKMPHPENDDKCDYLCSEEDLFSTVTADVCLDLALGCPTPSYTHKAEADWLQYILKTCKAAAMECGHLWFDFGLRGKIDWNTVGKMLEERGFEVKFYASGEHDNTYRPGCLGGIPGSVDGMTVYWGRRNKSRPSTTI